VTPLKSHLERFLTFVKRDLLKKKGKRRYIHPHLGVEGFFRTLYEREVTYSVLRWFETLPQVDPGEDIDILFADADIGKIDDLFTGTRSYGVPCDIYTESGLPGTSFRGIAYFPEHLAAELLASTELQDGLVCVPSPRHHYLSMIYHILYHKGYESGLSSSCAAEHRRETPDPADVDHDYPAVLAECARKAGMELPELNLEALDTFLEGQNWQPSRDALEKLAARNLWIHDRFFASVPGLDPHWRGFSVFIIRERGLEYLDLVRKMLFEAGFETLLEKPLDGQVRENAARTLRGGNWNRGPWPVSGGLPAFLIAVNDSFPLEPSDALIAKHRGLANSRLWETKIRIRDAVNSLQPKSFQCNILHSADNPHQGLEYFQTALPDVPLEKVEDLLEESRKAVSIPFPVIEEQNGHSRRAKVSRVSSDSGEAVAKVYRPGRERFLRRELEAREVGKALPEMSPVLEKSEFWFLMPRYRDILDHSGLLPLSVVKRVRQVLIHFRKEGYELIDFKPKNLIMDADDGLKVIDFEFLQRGGAATSSLKGNYCWYRVPDDFSGDVPVMTRSLRNNYYRFWFPATALPRCCVVRDLPLFILYPVRILSFPAVWLYHLTRYSRLRLQIERRRFKRMIISAGRKVLR
jgi:hypothetical protein